MEATATATTAHTHIVSKKPRDSKARGRRQWAGVLTRQCWARRRGPGGWWLAGVPGGQPPGSAAGVPRPCALDACCALMPAWLHAGESPTHAAGPLAKHPNASQLATHRTSQRHRCWRLPSAPVPTPSGQPPAGSPTGATPRSHQRAVMPAAVHAGHRACCSPFHHARAAHAARHTKLHCCCQRALFSHSRMPRPPFTTPATY